MGEQRKFLGMKSTPGEGAVTVVEMATKEFRNYANLVDKAAAGCKMIDSSFGRSSVHKKLSKQLCLLQRNHS